MKKYLLDTSMLLRFLLADHAEHSPIATRLFQQAADRKCLLVLSDLGIAEAVWVLTSYYKIDRKSVADIFANLVVRAGISCPSLDPVLDALARFKATNCDFFDCYLTAQAVASGIGVASFDRDFAKFTDLTLWDENSAD
jgi:predicted nucleic-acid-binding protein